MLRELLAKFGIEVDDTGLKKADAATNRITDAFNGLAGALAGSALIGGAYHFTQRLIDIGDELDKSSARLGMTVGELQAWRFAADRSGASAEQFAHGISVLNRNLGEAVHGGGAAQDFNRLGIKIRDASGQVRPTSQVIGDLAEKVAGAGSEAERAAIAMKFLGRGGTSLLPLLKGGRAEVEKLQKRFEELGGGLSEDYTSAAAKAKDAQTDLGLAVTVLKNKVGIHLFPAVTAVVEKITDFVVKIRKGTEGTNAFRVALGMVGIASGAVGIKLAAGVASKFGLVQMAAGGASRGVLGTASAFLKLTKAGVNLGLKFAIIFLLLEDLYTLFTGGDSAIGRFIDGMFGVGASKQFVEAVKNAWADFVDLLRAAWPAIEWLGGQIKLFLKDMFQGFSQTRKDIAEAWQLLGEDIQDFWNKAIRWAESGLSKIGSTIKQFQKDHPIIMGLANAATGGLAGLGAAGAGAQADLAARGVAKLDTGKALEVRNQTTIEVNGAGNARDVADRVAAAQTNVNNQNVAALGAVARP